MSPVAPRTILRQARDYLRKADELKLGVFLGLPRQAVPRQTRRRSRRS